MPSCKLQPGPVWVVRLNRQKSNALQGTTCSDWSINTAAARLLLFTEHSGVGGSGWYLLEAFGGFVVSGAGGRARVAQGFLRCLSLVANIELLSRGSSCIAAKLQTSKTGRVKAQADVSRAESGSAVARAQPDQGLPAGKMMERCSRWRP